MRGWWLAGVLVLAFAARGEVVCALGQGASSYKAAADQRPSRDSMQLAGRVNEAMRAICGDRCPTMGLFRNPTAANLMLIAGSVEAKMVYAPQFLYAVNMAFGDEGIIGLIAHELGHALDATIAAPWVNKGWPAEVRADAWAGCILANANLGPSGLDEAVGALSKYPASGQADWRVRLPVLRAGYTHCGGAAPKFDHRK